MHIAIANKHDDDERSFEKRQKLVKIYFDTFQINGIFKRCENNTNESRNSMFTVPFPGDEEWSSERTRENFGDRLLSQAGLTVGSSQTYYSRRKHMFTTIITSIAATPHIDAFERRKYRCI